jgi:class 3 adenylate cyclase
MDDVRAVLDAVGSASAVLLGSHDGCSMAALYAATYPERTRALVLFHPVAHDPSAQTAAARGVLARLRDTWGTQEQTDLFTDIVGSTERAAELGDRAWRELLARHHALVRRELTRFRGDEKDTAGDGFFATFDGPARAIRCAHTIVDGVRELGLEVRAGVHTGECELHEGKVAGLAVVIGARVAALARASEVLVSQTVKDLVAGAGVEFEERGERELKGVPGSWRLYAVADVTAHRQ